jgi:hypothetical protein
MDNKETKDNNNESEKQSPDFSCCGVQGFAEMAGQCCASAGEGVDCRSVMGECMKGCRWFPLIPVILGILFLLLGYYLDAEITRILWMVAAGFLILMGTFCLLMMSKMIRICHSSE